jgi:hypothetical protein
MEDDIKEVKKKIRPCPYCGHEREIKSPWKELFRKPTLNELIILFILIMVAVLSWAYKHDISICREYVSNIDYICSTRQANYGHSNQSVQSLNLTELDKIVVKTGLINDTKKNNTENNLTIP